MQTSICVSCFKPHKEDSCMTCAPKIKDHYKKAKILQRSSTFDEAGKMYYREFKTRSDEGFESLDFDSVRIVKLCKDS